MHRRAIPSSLLCLNRALWPAQTTQLKQLQSSRRRLSLQGKPHLWEERGSHGHLRAKFRPALVKCCEWIEVSCAGDTVSKLLWRMKNGEVPLKREPRVAVVLAGTEDLVSPACREMNVVHRAAADLRGLLVYMHR